jgi:hypothetical protein
LSRICHCSKCGTHARFLLSSDHSSVNLAEQLTTGDRLQIFKRYESLSSYDFFCIYSYVTRSSVVVRKLKRRKASKRSENVLCNLISEDYRRRGFISNASVFSALSDQDHVACEERDTFLLMYVFAVPDGAIFTPRPSLHF